jgi:hypothetical protein
VNPSVDKTTVASPVSPAAPGRPQRLWPVLVGLAALPIALYGLPEWSGNLVLGSLGVIVAYLLGIYLYKAVAARALIGGLQIIIPVAGAAAVLAAQIGPPEMFLTSMIHCAIIPLAAGLVGYRARTDTRALRLYLLGAAVVTLGGIAMYAPIWSGFVEMARLALDSFLVDARRQLPVMGLSEVEIEEGLIMIERYWSGLIRIIPAMSVMSLITPYTVGFLWFMVRAYSPDTPPLRLEPFTRWKVPFWPMPVLIVLVLGRLLGGETLVLAADNLLFVLSIYYCVGGLALIQSLLDRLKLPLFVKVVFYIMMTLTGVLGYALIVILGFIDSFADWRKVSAPSIELDKK